MNLAAPAALVAALEDAATHESGCLAVTDSTGLRSGRVYFADGKVYAVHVDGFRPKIGHRLRTGGMLSDEQYSHLLDQSGGNAYNPELGSLAVRYGLIEQDVLDLISREVLLSSIGAMFSWENLHIRFKATATTTDLTIPPVSVTAIVKAVAKRREHWETLWSQIAPGMEPERTYPTASAGAEASMSSELTAVIEASTGAVSLDEVAGECGLTRFETGHVLGRLVASNLMTMNPTPSHPRTEAVEAQTTPTHGTPEVAVTEPTGEAFRHTYTKPLAQEEPPVGATVPPAHDILNVELLPEADDTTPHFAPDVAVAVAETTLLEDEPSAFGEVEDSLPDGMDLGSIPTEVIQNDIDAALPKTTQPPTETAPAPAAEYTPVSVALPPAPQPVSEMPHFDEPVAPVPAPVAAEPPATQDAAPLPPGVPVFVDGSVLNHGQPLAATVEGMPGVPLPPLPVFANPTLPTVAPQVVPVAASQAPEVDGHSEVMEPAEVTGEHSPLDEARAEEARAEEARAEEARAEEARAEEARAEEARAEEARAEEARAEEARAEEARAEEARAEEARQRLLDEINEAVDIVTAAQNAVGRAEEEHEAHTNAALHAQETVVRYEAFIEEAQRDAERLRLDSAEAQRRMDEQDKQRQRVEARTQALTDNLNASADRLERAKNALAAAQQELAAATTHHEEAKAQRDDHSEALQQGADEIASIATHTEAIRMELAEVQERVVAYSTDLNETTTTLESLNQAVRESSSELETAQQRLTSAQEDLAAKQERLSNLG